LPRAAPSLVRAQRRTPGLVVERLARARVLAVCGFCEGDSHPALFGGGFAPAFYERHVQRLVDRVRADIRRRAPP